MTTAVAPTYRVASSFAGEKAHAVLDGYTGRIRAACGVMVRVPEDDDREPFTVEKADARCSRCVSIVGSRATG